MSDTPKTDKELAELGFGFYTMGGLPADAVKVEFARKLEREFNDLREIFPKILEALESGACAATCSVDFLREIPREVRLVRQRLERERDAFEKELAYVREVLLDAIPHAYGSTKKLAELLVAERDKYQEQADALLIRLGATQERMIDAQRERDEAVRACHIWQDGHSKIVADRDHWRAEAERWRDCHRDMVDDRDALIETLADIDSSAYKCDEPWETIERVSVITANLLNGRNPP